MEDNEDKEYEQVGRFLVPKDVDWDYELVYKNCGDE